MYNQYGIMGMMSQTPSWYWSFIRNGLWFILYCLKLDAACTHKKTYQVIWEQMRPGCIYIYLWTLYWKIEWLCIPLLKSISIYRYYNADNDSENSMLCNTSEHKHVTHDTCSSWNMIFYHILEIVYMSKNWTLCNLEIHVILHL